MEKPNTSLESIFLLFFRTSDGYNRCYLVLAFE